MCLISDLELSCEWDGALCTGASIACVTMCESLRPAAAAADAEIAEFEEDLEGANTEQIDSESELDMLELMVEMMLEENEMLPSDLNALLGMQDGQPRSPSCVMHITDTLPLSVADDEGSLSTGQLLADGDESDNRMRMMMDADPEIRIMMKAGVLTHADLMAASKELGLEAKNYRQLQLSMCCDDCVLLLNIV